MGKLFWIGSGVGLVAAVALVAHLLGMRFLTYVARCRSLRCSVGFYAKFLDIMARKGYVRAACTTPTEFLRSLHGLSESDVQVAAGITADFCAVRYGDVHLAQVDAGAMGSRLAQLAQLPRHELTSSGEDEGPSAEGNTT